MTVPTYYKSQALAQAALLPGQRVAGSPHGYYDTWAINPRAGRKTYSVPAGATVVHDGPSLAAALAEWNQTPIVLEPGVYDNPTQFTNYSGHSIYSAVLGKAQLTAGLVIGGNYTTPGAVLQGIDSLITDPAKAATDGGVLCNVNTWGAATKTSMLDCSFDGASVLLANVTSYANDGLVLQRCVGARVTGDNFRLSDNVVTSTAVITAITDVLGDGGTVYNNGTQGSVCWAGHPCLKLARIQQHGPSPATCVLWTGNSFAHTLVEDISADGPLGVLLYLEHFTLDSVFARGKATVTNIGGNAEWNDGTAGNEAADGDSFYGYDLTGTSGARAGFDFDAGSANETVDYCTFAGFTEAAIVAYENTGLNVGQHNTYDLPAGVPPVSYSHV